MKSLLCKAACIVVGSLLSGLSVAAISLGGTRLIVAAPAKEASIMVRNEASQTLMIQSWIEREDGADMQDSPLVVTPSLGRLDGNKQQLLRILYYGQGLPQDRESVFRLSVQEIPQKAETENALQIAVRQRIKVFYRPTGLPGTPDDASKKIKWSVARMGAGTELKVENPSAFHVSFSSVELSDGSKKYSVSVPMLMPYSTQRVSLKNDVPSSLLVRGIKVNFQSINDYGAAVSYSGVVE